MPNLIDSLIKDFPKLHFVASDTFYWSPKDQSVHYKDLTDEESSWKLLHETAHGVLGHSNYHTDFGLLNLEAQAWHTATELAQRYDIIIDQDHIEDCLDSYRDWLHARSTCPTCHAISLQNDPITYQCSNCDATWQVSRSRFCRPYRRRTSVAN